MKRILLFAICIVFSLAISVRSIAQTSISGIINFYSAIDSVYPTKDTLKVVDASVFNDGDTVMIYQAKGADIDVTVSGVNRHLWGNLRSFSKMNNTGKYEIIIIQEVLSVTHIRLRTKLDKEYDYDQPMQIISVPSYKSASIDGTLSCKSWDRNTGTGGVLVLMVSDTLFMNANIDVSGKGFEGAEPFEIEGECAKEDSATYASYFFHENADTISAGRKGEGFTLYDSAYSKGQGRWGTGGGGGNGRYSGGGGGGNYGAGGRGGAEDTTFCDFTYTYTTTYPGPPEFTVFYDLGGDGAFGSNAFGFIINDSVFTMGGGGGSGTYKTPLTSVKGGNGGGIVILMVRNLKVTNKTIFANGDSVTFVSTASGSGGGAGGMVGFDVDSVIGKVFVNCRGGKGGDVQEQGKSGPGGGGGGGAIFWKTPANPDPSVAEGNVNKGEKGDDNGVEIDFVTEDGVPGTTRQNYKVPLTGFLFNYVLDNQTVCMGDVPELLQGSVPRGGDGTFIYKWEKSDDNSTWIDADGTNNIIDYQPPALTDTIFYRRVVSSADIVDTSYSIKINVQRAIENNLIFGDDLIICINNEGDTITGKTVTIGGNETNDYLYNWQLRTDEGGWNSVAALNDTIFFPGIITDTSYVRRIVSSGACYDTTLNVEIIGLPPISNNTLIDEQEICYDEIPALIVGNLPGDGDGSYLYQWQVSTDNLAWDDITGANGKDYQPPALTDTTYYKRIVYSDDCEDESNVHTVIVLNPISNNIIIYPETPYENCYGTQTEVIDGSVPEGGRGSSSYFYQWQESTNAVDWSDIAENSDAEDYQSVPLTSNTYFRRYVVSGACEDSIALLEINILDLPIASITPFKDTICSGEEVNLEFNLSLGEAPYDLTYSDGSESYTENDLILGPNNVFINPTTNSEQHIFNYTITAVVDNNGCEATEMEDTVTITTYGNPESNAGPVEEFCSLDYTLKAVESLGDGLWTQMSGIGTTSFADKTKPNATISVSQAGIYTYKWKETNWQCVDSAEVDLTLYQPITDLYAGKDTSLFFIDKFELRGEYTNPDNVADTTTLWEILQGYGIIENPENRITNISDLVDDTREGIIVQWTVEKGICVAQVDSLVIRLQEIFTPTGFTPNGDGINDYLKFNGLENAAEYEIVIFNRWGTEVFRKLGDSDNLEWDGKNKNGNELPDDTYYYLLNVKNKNGTSDSHKGFIIIKRG